MHWLVQSCLGLRWALPYLLAWSNGSQDCEAYWIHDVAEAVAVGPLPRESMGEPPSDEDYYDTPAVVCDDFATVCTSAGCGGWP